VTFHLQRHVYGRAMFKIIALILCLFALAPPGFAQSSQQTDRLNATLLPGWQTEGGRHMAGLQLTLAPGWKTYWRSPGEAGIPPLFNWSGSENLKSVRVHWPTPAVFQSNGLRSIGYHDQVTLPLEVTALDPAKPVRLHAVVDLGVCNDICLPASLDLTTDLVGPGASDAAIQNALAAEPKDAAQAGLVAISCAVDPIADGLKITATLQLPPQGGLETVAFETDQPEIWVAEAKTTRSGAQLVSVTDMVPPTGAPFALDRSKIKLTVIAEGHAVEIRGCPAS
jgi:DsbC/DsbD-like thiol-disulfide interchange protein